MHWILLLLLQPAFALDNLQNCNRVSEVRGVIEVDRRETIVNQQLELVNAFSLRLTRLPQNATNANLRAECARANTVYRGLVEPANELMRELRLAIYNLASLGAGLTDCVNELHNDQAQVISTSASYATRMNGACTRVPGFQALDVNAVVPAPLRAPGTR